METIVEKAKKKCLQLLNKSRCSSLPFHNWQHTLEVYKNALTIGAYGNISKDALEPALLAALFHDTGNARVFLGHEDVSIKEATGFLKSQEYAASKIQKVTGCIEATRMPQDPKDILEKIICDADLFHLGTKSYFSKNQLLRTEWAMYRQLDYSDQEWITLNIKFLQQHQFHTKYGKTVLQPIKEENCRLLSASL